MPGRYEQALASLNAAQKRAVETIDGPVLVIAGPGTGKTQLLTTRIAHILNATDTLPQNILCLTFTDSAAQTMRTRLSDMIGQGAYDVTIGTYHAFGSELIRRYPDFFAEQADMEPVDDLGIDRIFRAIIADLPFSNPLKYADTYLGDIKTLVSDAKRALFTPDDLQKIAKANLSFIAKASPIVSDTLGVITRIDKKCIPLFRQLADTFPDTKKDESLAAVFAAQLHEAVALAEESGKTNTLTAWKNTWLAKNDQGQFIVEGERANQKLLAAASVYAHYLQALSDQKLFDYDDMILRAVTALQDNAEFRYTLQEQYQYILLDEFQDTNGAQLRLVQLLTDNPVNEGRPNVLAVGDDDQAIYAFQGANYSHMLQFKEMYRDVVAIPLTENYRSHADILSTSRGVAEQIEERLHHHFPEIEKTLTAAGKNLPAKSVIERREAQSDVMQFAWAARRIQALLKDGTPAHEIAVLAPQHKYLVPLVPFLQTAGIAVRYEKRENVLDDPRITQLTQMAQLVLALETNNRLGADSLWAEILSYDFWGLPTSVIWQLSWQTNDQRLNWTDELLKSEELKPIALFFIRLSQIAPSETLETMFDYLIGSAPLNLSEPGEPDYTSPFFTHHFGDIEASAKDGQTYSAFWELLSNLIVLRTRLRDYRKADGGDERLYLKDLLEFIAAHRAADIKILNTSPYASGADAVQLLTAFKAKGMEFSAVFVLAVNDEAWGSKARSMGSRLPLPANLQFIRYAGATNDERLRLFYVAITRAKSQLFLLNYAQNYSGKSLTRLRYLNEFTNEAGGAQSPLLPADAQAILPAEDDAPTPTTELAAYWQQRHESALLNADMRALLEDRLSNYQLSPTHLNDFIDVANCGPQAFFLRTILRFPQAPKPQIQYGNAIHETLEWLHTTTKKQGSVPSESAMLKAFERLLGSKRLSEHDTALYLDRGQSALKIYLAKRGDSISGDDIVEYNFRSEGAFAGKAHLGGKIDKLVVNKTDKTIQIIDFKTGKGSSRWTKEVKLHKYKQQLYLYKALVEGSHTFAGYQVTDAYLEFVEPDEDGNILQLHVQFNDEEYKRITRLAEIVWEHIKNIDLPDTSGYNPDLSGVDTFENDLLTDLL